MSRVDSIESVNDLVFKALNTPSWALDHYNPLKPEQIAIKAFVNRMGPDLTGPNFNQSQEETVEVLAKRAKHNLFGADDSDTKSLVNDITKTEEEEADEKDAADALDKREREAQNSGKGAQSEEEVGVSMKDMRKKLESETQEIEEDLRKDADNCEPLQEIVKKAEKVIPPPPPPEPKVIPPRDNRTELEKAYDRATEAIIKEKERVESIQQEDRDKINRKAGIDQEEED